MPLTIEDLDISAQALEEGDAGDPLGDFNPYTSAVAYDPRRAPQYGLATTDPSMQPGQAVYPHTVATFIDDTTTLPPSEETDRTLLYAGGALLLAAAIAYAVTR